MPVQSIGNGVAERGKSKHLAIPKRTGPNLPCPVNMVLMGVWSQVLLSKGGTGRTRHFTLSQGRGSICGSSDYPKAGCFRNIIPGDVAGL